jgi:hypothetical protein
MAKAKGPKSGVVRPLPSPTSGQFRPFQRIEIVTDGQEERGLILLWLQKGGFALMREVDHDAFKEWLGLGPDDTVEYYCQSDGKRGDLRGRQYVYARDKEGNGVSVCRWMVFKRKTSRKPTYVSGNTFDLRPENVRPKSAKPVDQD